MPGFFSSIGSAVTSAISSVKFGKESFAEYTNAASASFYAFSARYLNSDAPPLNFDQLKGKVVLVINIASMCGYTAGNNVFMGQLASKYIDRDDFRILAFPCAQFNSQEHAEESKACSAHMDGLKDYKNTIGKNLLLMEKIDVNGPTATELYKFLKFNSSLKDEQSKKVSPIPWNYCKFLVDKEGHVVQFYKSDDKKDVEDAVGGLMGHKSSRKDDL